MSNRHNFDPDIEPTRPSPPPNQNPSESEETTQQQMPNSPNHQPPNSNNTWRIGDIKIDLDEKEYQIEERLGSGGFAVTYLAIELVNKQKVVLKVLKNELKDRPDFRIISNSFINEALRLKACQSSFIVTVDKVTEIDHKQVIVMEYIEGKTLGDKAREMEGQLPVHLALKYIKQVGEALKKVHGQNLLHRDIKPENIMIRASNNQAVLIDFGLALKFDPNNLAANRQWFTPGYAPIEQYKQQVQWGYYTDVYSLAATLYYILTGEIPIDPENRLFGMRLNSPKSLNNNISETVNDAIIEGLKVAPDARPQTVEDWLRLFDESPNSNSIGILTPNFSKLTGKLPLILLLSLGILGLTVMVFLLLRKPVCDSDFSPILTSLNMCEETGDNWKNYDDYESTEYEFKVKYPSKWRVTEVPKKDVFDDWELRVYAANHKEPTMIIIVEELRQLYSLNEYWRDVIKPRLKNSQLPDISVEEKAQSIKLKKNSGQEEHPALTHNYSYTQNNQTMQIKEIITVYNYKGYTILFRGNKQDFKKYQKEADKIIRSFEFIISE